MTGTQRYYILTWFVLGSTLVSVAWAIAWGNTVESREAIKAGLVQVEYPSQSYCQEKWVKP